MKKKVFAKIDKEKSMVHEYNIVRKNNKTKLKYSNNADWSDHVIDKTAINIKETGDGYKVKSETLDFFLDYHVAFELLILLEELNEVKYKIK